MGDYPVTNYAIFKTAFSAFALTTVLAGCMETPTMPKLGDLPFMNKSAETAPQNVLSPEMATGEESAVINSLLERKSVLPDGPFATVADAVLDANSRAAEAELRAARLRAEAASTNWLPTLGPQISLTSLGSVVAGLVVEQALFDNGRRKAEREYAVADVEVAAVALAQDTNQRVLTALELYLRAEENRATAAVNAAAMERMNHFAYIMRERVRGGVSNRADLQIVEQKLNQMQSDLMSDREEADAAIAELNAMSAHSVSDVTGLSALAATSSVSIPLSVAKSQAEASRQIAEAKIARAGYLPGLSATGSVTISGSDFNLGAVIPNGIGFGNGAAREAIEAQSQAAEAKVAQTREDTNRQLRALESELASLQRQAEQARSIASQAAANYDIFASQLREGQRTVNDVVGVFETKVRTERAMVAFPYQIALVELKIAAIQGALVDGGRI